MAIICASFDPTIPQLATGKFDTALTNGGWLMIHNESPISMLFDLGINRGNVMVAAQHLRCVNIGIATSSVKYQTVSQYIQPTNGILSRVYAEAYQPNEWSGGEFYVPLAGPLFQDRIISLPMLTLGKGTDRVTLPANTQANPPATGQTLATRLQAGAVGTAAFEAIYSVEIYPETVGECTIALGIAHVDSGGSINGAVMTPFAYCNVAKAGQFGPTQACVISYNTPLYLIDSWLAGDSTVGVYYYLLDGGGGMMVDISVNWSVTNASSFGLTTITPPAEYGTFLKNSRSVF